MKLTPEQIKQQLKLAASGQSGADLNVSLEEIESFGDNESLKSMLLNIDRYNSMLKERITLINESLSAAIPFTRENLYLFCAFSGNGKSTVAANISHPLWKQQKKILVISNEESQQDILFRIACLELGLSFNAYKKGEMPPEDQKRVLYLFPEISQWVKVIDVNYKNGLTTKIEGVKNILEAVRKQDGYSCVMIDYYQLIKFSVQDRHKTTYENLNDLRVWLGQYIKNASMPVVLFVQLYSLSKKGGAKDIDARIKECSAVIEPATVIIELVPNFELKTTDFVIHKDRFGRAGQKITCTFENGQYCKASDIDIIKRQKLAAAEEQEQKLKDLNVILED